MPARHVVVDGSNIATEGNSLPRLKQLDEAVREFLVESPGDIVTVVVDASFGHRVDPSERERFEQAEAAGEIVSPPAGAIGRGDAFLLRIADKVNAVVLSNDSFQEFHGEYEWLFEKGRLIGGKPVPGIGWVFTPRTPVRGPKSRESVKVAKRKGRDEELAEAAGSGLDMAAERSKGGKGERKLARAIAVAVEEAVEPAKERRRRRRHRGGEPPAEPLNEPLNFINFIALNRQGDEVHGTVEEFSSHGAFVTVDGARCYVPLSGMGDPAPRSAREALRKGEVRSFVVQAFDAARRGIELALPGFVHLAGVPTEETVEAEIHRRARNKPALAKAEPGPAKPTKRAAPRVPPAKVVLRKPLLAGAAPAKAGRAQFAPPKALTSEATRAEIVPRKAAASKAAAGKVVAGKVRVMKVATRKTTPIKVATDKGTAAKMTPGKAVAGKGAVNKVAAGKVAKTRPTKTATRSKPAMPAGPRPGAESAATKVSPTRARTRKKAVAPAR